MKLASITLRYQIARPQASIHAMSDVDDRFALPDYACETEAGNWVRITHVESGKYRLVPVYAVKCADPVQVEQAPAVVQGKKR